jgi:hypothetical protein
LVMIRCYSTPSSRNLYLPGDYPYLFSRVASQSHWPSLQTKPPNMIGLLPSFGANKPAGWTYEQSPVISVLTSNTDCGKLTKVRNPDQGVKCALAVNIQGPSLAAGDLNALGIGGCAWAEQGSALAFPTLGTLYYAILYHTFADLEVLFLGDFSDGFGLVKMYLWVVILCIFLHEFSLPPLTPIVERRLLLQCGSGDVTF